MHEVNQMAQPIYKTKNGQFSAAIFENAKGKSVALQKSYTDKEGNWQNQSITVFPRDIDKVIEVLQEAKKQCESPDSAPEEGAASSSIDKSIDPSLFEEVKTTKKTLPGGDELVIEEPLEEDEEEFEFQLNLQDFPMKRWSQ